MNLTRLEHIFVAGLLSVMGLVLFNAQARATTNPPPTYSLSLSGGSFSPSPLIVDDTQPAPGTVTSTASVSGSVEVNNPNNEYQKNNDDQWTYYANVVGYSGSDSGDYGPLGSNSANAPQVSGSSNGTITLTANEQTMTGYYEVQVTASDQFTVKDSATNPASTIQENPPSVSETLDITVGAVSISGPTGNVIVGEQVSYAANYSPADLNPSFSWNIPGTIEDRVKSAFAVTYMSGGIIPQSGVPVGLTSQDLQNQSVELYWVSSGSKNVTCSVGGKTPSTTTTVVAPTATITPVANGGMIQVLSNNGTSYVQDGTQTVPGLDLSATFSVPAGYTVGGYSWVQIMVFNTTYDELNGHIWLENITGVDGYLANPNASRIDYPNDEVDPAQLYLGPGRGFTTLSDVSTVTVAKSCTDYLMFTPGDASGQSLPASIAVPVAFEKWSYPATVQLVNGQYKLTTSSTPPTPSSTKPSSIWPTFTNDVLNVVAVETK